MRLSVFAIALTLLTTTLTAAPRQRIVRMPEIRSTVQLIDEALSRGEIDQETALIYQVFASFDDDRLPQRFRGDVTTFGVDTSSVAEVVARWETLSAAGRETLAPYVVPPFYEGSRQGSSAQDVGTNEMSICGRMDFDWESIRTPSGRARIWWKKTNTADGTTAASLVAVADRALDLFASLLGRDVLPDDGSTVPCRGGDDALDIAIVGSGSEVIPFFPGTKEVPTYVLLQRNAPDGVEMTLVHELFHVFQYTYDVKEFGVLTQYKWLMEATATWAQHYYSPAADSGKEHRAAPLYLAEPEKSLDVSDRKREYGAYLFFLYLSQKFGDGTIKAVWDATLGADALQAVDSAIPGGFRARWPEFALYNWNRDPVNDYEQWDNLTAKVTAKGGHVLAPGRSDLHADLLVDLPRLSATYKHFTFTPNARSFAFLNGLTFNLKIGPAPPLGAIEFGDQYQWTDRADEAREAATVQVLIRKNGQWESPENWTEERYKPFCRQKDDEAIDEIVLIFANSSMEEDAKLEPAELAPRLVVTNMGCHYEGTAKFDLASRFEPAVGDLKVTLEPNLTPLDAEQYKNHFLGYALKPGGKAKYTITGSIADCSVNAAGEVPLREIVHFVYNFAPPGSETYRQVLFPMNIPDPIKYDVHCPTGTVQTTTGFGSTWPELPWETFDVDAEGNVKGEEDVMAGRWEWEFKPKD